MDGVAAWTGAGSHPDSACPKEETREIEEAALTAGEFSIALPAGVLTAEKRFDHLRSNTPLQQYEDMPASRLHKNACQRFRREPMKAIRQHRLMVTLCIVVFSLGGCGSVLSQVRMNQFTDTAKGYGAALLWGHYEAANLYRKPELAAEEKPDFEKLQNIKVAQYDIKEMNVSDDGMRVDQQAEITYFHRDKMILKTVRDQQVWEFDTGDSRWYLTTRMPDFP